MTEEDYRIFILLCQGVLPRLGVQQNLHLEGKHGHSHPQSGAGGDKINNSNWLQMSLAFLILKWTRLICSNLLGIDTELSPALMMSLMLTPSYISVGNINEAKTEIVRHHGQGFWNISSIIKGQFGKHVSWIFLSFPLLYLRLVFGVPFWPL